MNYLKEEQVAQILSIVKQNQKPTQLLLEVLNDFIKENPNELPAFNKFIAVLTSTALAVKDSQYNKVVNSLQSLMYLEELKSCGPNFMIIELTAIMQALFPEGYKINASNIESNFYDEYISNLKRLNLSEVEWLEWWAKKNGYYDYLTKLLEINSKQDEL